MRTRVWVGLGVTLVVAIGCGVPTDRKSQAGTPEGVGASVAAPAGEATAGGVTAAPATPVPVPADQVFQGKGDKVIRLTLPEGFVHIATITHTGRSNFAVVSLDAGGGDLDLIVNEIGNYSGVRPLDFAEKPAALKVTADGNWKFVIQAAQKAPLWTGTSSGKGAAVLRMAATSGLTTLKISHSGKSNFVVIAYGDSKDLLVNEIGTYSGETLLPSGAVLLEIEADGNWTIEKSS
jgi:hypothetical protein